METNLKVEDLYSQVKEFDLICSLGANCSAANQLKRRNLRQVALPLDWTWFNSVKSIEALAEGFQTGFKNYMLPENLRKLEGSEYSQWHSDRWQYEDLNTGVRYFNHFYRTDDENAEIQRVIGVFRKRCERLDYFLKNSKKVLLILSIICDVDTACVKKLLNTIQKKYPNCEINIHFQAFGCKNDECYQDGNLTVVKYKREENTDDYLQTNFEWRFLDNLKLSELFYYNREQINCNLEISKEPKNSGNIFIKVWKLKRGGGISFFPLLNTMLYLKFYLFGIRFHFSIGKNKIE